MPRPKKIESVNNEIKLSDMTIEDIENNDCFSAELYISGLDEKTWYLINNFYKFTVVGDRNGFNMMLGNSWKGLIQLLLSILYCKVGGKIVALQAYYENHFVHHISVDHDFELLKSADIPNSPIIEKLYVPPSYRPMYVRSNYTDKNVFQALMSICRILKIDTKKSKVSIKASDNSKRYYKDRIIDDKADISKLICNIIPICSNEGTAFVTRDTMKTLLIGKYLILIAHPTKTPQQLKKWNEDEWKDNLPYEFLAYPVLKRYKEQLIKYFPLYKDGIIHYTEKTNNYEFALSLESSFLEIGCDYIITDFEYMGIWG